MSHIDWSYIDKVVYINLKRRSDRNYRIKKQLEYIGIEKGKIIRFDAVETNPGFIGCTQSHIAVIEMAISEKWSNVLILEDDFEFAQELSVIYRTNKYLGALRHVPWSVAFFSANYSKVTPFKNINYIVKVDKSWCACAYAVNSDYYEILLDNFKQGLEHLQRTRQQHRYALDVYWQILMDKHCWLGVYPSIGHQTPDKSDIENKFVDYKALFYKDISIIRKKI
ncbi:glycosyltransferase [Citrobacter werkmanii]|uniref:glycosyltransferase family 25 protein n=1 Tax=Citrobacter werkmanii TaxID=67827 RepID=UPI00076F083B|nr:glycosyltransferase [Citrobacter werkmanii]EGT0671802.1 glycosyltransferase [Citrobacter werkmanii]GAS74174.1 glycosyltransferase family 25 [Salmonella enterica]GAS79884.1 glycosyltransferase family 25 [Salmonella enterica]HBC9521000.1 glycosyltransferase family 25 protein [Escherichia coli]